MTTDQQNNNPKIYYLMLHFASSIPSFLPAIYKWENCLALASGASSVAAKQHPMHASSWTPSQTAMPG